MSKKSHISSDFKEKSKYDEVQETENREWSFLHVMDVKMNTTNTMRIGEQLSLGSLAHKSRHLRRLPMQLEPRTFTQ